MSNNLSKGDSTFDQLHAEIRDAAISDVSGWVDLGRKINDASDTREAAGRIQFTREEKYKIIRLAHLSHQLVTGRLLGRKI